MKMIRSIIISLIVLFHFPLIQPVKGTCSNSFSTSNNSEFCYYYQNDTRTWLDAYHHCLTRTLDGTLMKISNIEQFQQLKIINIDTTNVFWLGANNFRSTLQSEWHWLDGSPVDIQTIKWCSNSTYQTAIGAYCAAYDSQSHCVTNYLCQTLLPAPCFSTMNNLSSKTNLARSQPTDRSSTGLCGSTLSNSYGNWWTYTVLLLNWFLFFCFFLYLCNRLILDKNTLIFSSLFTLFSFIMILIFAILWGVQYQDIIQIPLAIVILGSIASVLLILVLIMILSKRNLVRRWMACVVVLGFVLVVESFLMLGLILCTAYCSGYISLASTSIDKDVIASMLASLVTAISILCQTGLLSLLDNTVPDRVQPIKPTPALASIPKPPPSMPAPASSFVRHSQTNIQRPSPMAPTKKSETIERATSPVDERVLEEFYADQSKDMHTYSLGGRRYIVYEGKHHAEDIESYRKDLVQAMLLQEPEGLQQAIERAKTSIHTIALRDDIEQAETLAAKLS